MKTTKTTAYKVNWDNGGSACGTFPQVFDTEAEAEDYGLNWQLEMNECDGTAPEDSGYSYDVIEVEVDVADEGDLCDGLPEYNGWKAYYEYPGFISYVREGQDVGIAAGTEGNTPELLINLVDTTDGDSIPSGLGFVPGRIEPWPLLGRTSEKLFALLKPHLDEITGLVRRHPCTKCGAVLIDEIESVCSNPGEGCCPPEPELTAETITTEQIHQLRNKTYRRVMEVRSDLAMHRARIPALEAEEQELDRIMIATGVALGIAMDDQKDYARARCVELLLKEKTK